MSEVASGGGGCVSKVPVGGVLERCWWDCRRRSGGVVMGCWCIGGVVAGRRWGVTVCSLHVQEVERRIVLLPAGRSMAVSVADPPHTHPEVFPLIGCLLHRKAYQWMYVHD